MEWYIKVVSDAFDFKSRSRRKEYWMFVLMNLVVGITLTVVAKILASNSLSLVKSIYDLLIFIPSLAVGIRRLHDTNRSGWWILVPFYNLYLLCIPGDRGPNRFGADPKAAAIDFTSIPPKP